MNILERIVEDKRIEVDFKKSVLPEDYLRKSPMILRETYSLKQSLKDGSGIIAEFKRRSPSKQLINQKSSLTEVVTGYQAAGASGISVLTDTKYFGGALDDLLQARASVRIPVLRKDFMIDPYQLFEAKAFGADVILLIAAVLSPKQVEKLSQLAHDLGLEVLMEVHNEEELKKNDLSHIDLVGVNNRNLKTFEVSLETSKHLSEIIPGDKMAVSESGISDPGAIRELRDYGFKGFLIGENFMKTENPGAEAEKFINAIEA
ncbi:MAG: indole-3-glycerol phosphate synthase TrpC [Lutimonas sp.]